MGKWQLDSQKGWNLYTPWHDDLHLARGWYAGSARSILSCPLPFATSSVLSLKPEPLCSWQQKGPPVALDRRLVALLGSDPGRSGRSVTSDVGPWRERADLVATARAVQRVAAALRRSGCPEQRCGDGARLWKGGRWNGSGVELPREVREAVMLFGIWRVGQMGSNEMSRDVSPREDAW